MTHPPVTRRTIGSWEILEVIGSGSFAIVWKARHVATGALAAVKEILSDRLNKKLQESLESEIAVLQRLKHANIVGLLDLYKEPGKIFLVLEYCGGGDLARHLRQRGPLSEASCRYLLRHLAEGLKVLRQHNVIHRDLKPQNLLLSDNGPSPTLKIADFGFARSLQPAGLAETLCGSPLYMAPEVLQLHRYDAKADLWSVGTILFELLTGKPPFDGANHFQLVQNIERGDAVLPDHVARSLSPGCRQLLHQLLRRNPVERISFDELFAHPFLVGEAASAAVVYPLALGVTPPAGAAAAPAGAAPVPMPQHAQRRYTPTSQGAVRFVQPVRCGSPVHPAFQIPTPSSSTSPNTQQQQPQQKGAPAVPAGPFGAATAAEATPLASVAPGGPGARSPSPRPAGGDAPPAAQAWQAPGGDGGTAGGVGGPAPTINVRELTRSPSPRIIAAAALVASALMGDTGNVTATAGATGTAAGTAPAAVREPSSQPPPAAGCSGPGRGIGCASGNPGSDSSIGGLGGGPASSGGPLVDSVDSDYVVISSPSATPRPPVPLSPRVPHPAMASSKGSRSGSAGGAPPAAQAQPPSAPEPPAPAGYVGTTGRPPGAAAAAAAAAVPSWQQVLSPIAAATLPPSSQGLPYTPALGPGRPHSAAAAAAPGVEAAAAAAAATVTIRVPPPGGCCAGTPGPGPGDSEAPADDALLLPRVVGVLLDHAQSRCGALLDQEAEARQLGAGGAAVSAGLGFAAGGGFGATSGLGSHGSEAHARASMADEAAAAVGTLLVACRLLVAALGSASAGAAGGDRGVGVGGTSEAAAVEADPSVPKAAAAAAAPSPASLQTLAALAMHARSALSALDEHLYGTVSQLLLGGADGPGPAPAPAARSATAAGQPSFPAGAPPTPLVPCALDTLMAVAVHHSRAAAGEELLGNAVGAAEQYGRAADVLLFLLGAPSPATAVQQQQLVDRAAGAAASPVGLLLDAARPALMPHDRQRLTKYYVAVRLRQSAALAAAGPGAATAAGPPSQQPLPHHPHLAPQSRPHHHPGLQHPHQAHQPHLAGMHLHQHQHHRGHLARHGVAGAVGPQSAAGGPAVGTAPAVAVAGNAYGYGQSHGYGAVVV